MATDSNITEIFNPA